MIAIICYDNGETSMAFKIGSTKSNAEGRMLFVLVWAATCIAVFERNLNRRNESTQKSLDHE